MSDFIIANDIQANEIIKKIKEIDAEKASWENYYDERKKAVIEEFNGKREYYISKLGCYFEREDVKKRNTKTTIKLQLPEGILIFTKPSQKMEYDEDKLIEYLETNSMSDFVNSKKSVAWNELKKKLKISQGKVVNIETGEVVDIISVSDVMGRFEVK